MLYAGHVAKGDTSAVERYQRQALDLPRTDFLFLAVDQDGSVELLLLLQSDTCTCFTTHHQSAYKSSLSSENSYVPSLSEMPITGDHC